MKRLNKDKRTYLIVGLCAILVIMAVGYAAFASQLTINSAAEITSTWDVHIKNNPTTENVVSATNVSATKTSALTAEFECELTTPGTSTITYLIPVINSGSLNARLTNINVTGGNTAISVVTNPTNASLSGTPVILNASGGEATVKVVVSYNNINTPPTGNDAVANITVTLDFVQTDEEAVVPFSGTIYRDTETELAIGDSISSLSEGTDYELTDSSFSGVYLKHTIVNEEITESYACLKYASGHDPICLKGGSSDFYAGNQAIITNVKSEFESAVSNGSCSGTLAYNYDNNLTVKKKGKNKTKYIVKNMIYLAALPPMLDYSSGCRNSSYRLQIGTNTNGSASSFASVSGGLGCDVYSSGSSCYYPD